MKRSCSIPPRYHGERAAAADAIRLAGDCDDWEANVVRLLRLGDEDSARLACELIDDVGAPEFSSSTCVETVLAHLGLSVSPFPRSDTDSIWNVRTSLFSDLDQEQLCTLLDDIADAAQVLTRDSDPAARAELERLVVRLVGNVLEAQPEIEAERVWAWIGWLEQGFIRGDRTRERLAGILAGNKPLRAELIEVALLGKCPREVFAAGCRLTGMGLELHPTDEDVASLLRVLRARAGDGSIDPDMWRSVLYLSRSKDGMSAVVREAAEKEARKDPALLAVLADVDRVVGGPVGEGGGGANGESRERAAGAL